MPDTIETEHPVVGHRRTFLRSSLSADHPDVTVTASTVRTSTDRIRVALSHEEYAVKNKLEYLYTLQLIDTDLDTLQEQKGDLPFEVEALEN